MNLPTHHQFSEFFQAIHGVSPFPWQERLALRVCAGDWPRAIALPTAAGKTGCIDIAVFALACRAKAAPRRILFVVDRRIVVDQAFDHAKKLAKALGKPDSTILKQVADSLRELADDERPLDVYALRGGMYRESAWLRSPLQPTVIASTVDQVGSRLLFRGYGVSDSMKPIHAGLVGNDALILLDEAHCAKPFDQTVQAVEKYRLWNDTSSPFRFVSITATPSGELPSELIERDEKEDRDHPVLGKRITTSKPAKFVVAEKAKGKKGRSELVKVLEQQARELAKEFACVGIIVNRVATARELNAKLGDDTVLLTGRMRPLDRDRLLREKLQPLLSNAEGKPPQFLIGTQCLECGADFDFHALVTECASLDALRQRFGRLNRVARRTLAKAVIVIRGDETEDTSEDPVYGASLANTWKWLKGKATDDIFDFGVAAVRDALNDVSTEDLASLNAPTSDAPVLFPAHLDCWVQTNPIPEPDPDPALFLHGPKRTGQPDVQVVFRNDLGDNSELWADIVALCPPSSSEAVAVPIGTFQKWMSGELTTDDTSDVEGAAEIADESLEPAERWALRWQGAEKSTPVSNPKDVRPSGLYVVPCSAAATESLGDFPFGLTDLAEEAFQKSRDKAILRLTDSKLSGDADDFDDLLSAEIEASYKGDSEARDGQVSSVPNLFAEIEPSQAAISPHWLKTAVAALLKPNRREVDPYPHPLGGWVVTGKKRLGQFDPTYLDDTDPAESYRGREVKLEDHSNGVAGWARRFAAACGLDAELYAQAGLWHDLGKLDSRFQAMLKQSSPRTVFGEPLAKSAKPPRSRRERELTREIHGYPSGARHELFSAALVAMKTDDDLLLHLIATHHGSARPFADPVKQEATEARPFTGSLFGTDFALGTYTQEIACWNTELPERFWRIVRKYGWWGSAYREAIFRLADHTQSRLEQESDAKPDAIEVTAFRLSSKKPETHSIPLTGLDGSNPLAFLAALGTFRITDELFPGTHLRWEQNGRWIPILELPTKVSSEELSARVFARLHRVVDQNADKIAEDRHKAYRKNRKETEKALKSIKERKLRGKEREAAVATEVDHLAIQEFVSRRDWLQALESAVPAPFLSLGKSIAVTAEEFAAFAIRTADRLHQVGSRGRIDADFASAFGCESCVDKNGRVIPTELQLITGSGHQFFLDTFSTLIQSVSVEQLQRAMFGPWTYIDPRLSFRWDPSDDRRYAISWADPSDSEVRTEHGANLLAAYALPFFPVAPMTRRAVTTGFNFVNGDLYLTWPIWQLPRSPDTVRSLLQLGPLHRGKPDQNALDAVGVRLGFRVRKFEVGTPPLAKLNLCPAIVV